MISLKFTSVFGLFLFLLLWSPAHAQIIDQSLCTQCLTATKAELKKCLVAAISQEDKKSCQEKQETHTKTCENECKIAKAAEDAIISEGYPQFRELLSNK